MQKELHPEYRPVVFKDSSCDAQFIINSAVQTKETIDVDGSTYPLVLIDISSASHPVYTGERRAAVSEGRVARFQRKFNVQLGSKK